MNHGIIKRTWGGQLNKYANKILGFCLLELSCLEVSGSLSQSEQKAVSFYTQLNSSPFPALKLTFLSMPEPVEVCSWQYTHRCLIEYYG